MECRFACHDDTKFHALTLAQIGLVIQCDSSMKYLATLPIILLAACAPQPSPVKRQMVGLLEKFDRWDYDGDGQLALSELEEAEELSGLPAAEILVFYDTSKNRRISYVEAEAGMSRLDEANAIVEAIKERP